MDFDLSSKRASRRSGPKSSDLSEASSRLSHMISAAPSSGTSATATSSSPPAQLMTMVTSSIFSASNVVVLWTRFAARVEQQLSRRVLGQPLSPLTHHCRFFLCLLLLFVAVIVSPSSAQLVDSFDKEIRGLMGHEVEIPCEVSSLADKCPEIHSTKWYQNDQRIYMHIASLEISNPEGRFQPNQPGQPSRAVHNANVTPPVLRISPVQIADEGIYRCDVTYKDLTPGCPIGSTIKLNTFAIPQAPEIFEDIAGIEKPDIATGTLVGPYQEGATVTLICEAAGGKPAASVAWLKNSKILEGGDFLIDDDVDGTQTVKNRLIVKVTREDLLVRYECQVHHEETLEQPLTSWVQMDVYVPPEKLKLEGNNTQLEDDNITLTCTASGARPAATIRWFNGSEPLAAHSLYSKVEDVDGTSASYSYLSFPASRYDDEEVISCEATNPALEDGQQKTLRESSTLTIYYPPIVTLLPDVAILEINESSPLRLECSYESNPAGVHKTSVTWIRNELNITKTGSGDEEDGTNSNNNTPDDQTDDEGAVKEGRYYYDIKSIQRHEDGIYSCLIANFAGIGKSESINVSVLYPPEVRMMIFPTLAIEHKTNVSLTCEIEDANPAQVTSVRWYRNGEIFNETDETKLFLPEVDRTFHSNYSCQAENRVGWSNISEVILLNVMYTPGRAKLTHIPSKVIKDQAVTLLCEVADLGNPPVTDYIWKRGDAFISGAPTRNLTIKKATLNTLANFTCIPRNEAGYGIAGEISLDVYAPPSFRVELLPHHGALETATDISLTCQVECHPRCHIEWLRDGEVLRIPSFEASGYAENGDEADNGNGKASNGLENETADKSEDHNGIDGDGDWDQRYSEKISYLDFNLETNYFPSVISTLRWNMSFWPDGRLHRVEDSANYTCRSSSNAVGPGVSNTTVFNVEYPPENISLSTYKVNVKEGEHVSSPVTCLASGQPEVRYMWTYNESLVSSTNKLPLDYPASRNRSGLYHCTATNVHGNASRSVFLDVLYEPKCDLVAKMEDIGTVLICSVLANPEVVEFEWLLDNETIKENIHSEVLVSRLTQVRSSGRYICMAKNSVGQSKQCVLELQDADGALFVAGFSDNRVIIIVIVVAAIIIIAVIIAVIIILLMKRRSAVGKLGKPRRSDQPTGPVSEGDRAFYENLPFHGLQPAPNKPFKPALPDLEYADVEFPPQDQQVDGTPQRPPRTGKPTTNNNHA